MARIIIFGGHGKIALLTEPLLAGRGDAVTAVIRNPDQADDVRAAGAEPLVVDVEQLDVDQLTEVVAGHDAVVWSAGAGGGDARRTLAVDRDAAIRTMDAAARAGVQRYVMVSYFGASRDHGVDPENSFYTYAEAKSQADEHLRESGLAWTVLGPSGLTLDPGTGAIDVDPAEASTVARADVAATIAAVLADESTVHRSIRFNSGETPIAEAVRAQ
ncbi:SDR family oxidoreductase [Leucobacter chromiiresistens]|uniref:NAD-dependent dehydratase n=1 Tax=Leucobacter chromiiresistens TaxID=1079994 RepID=A0A147EMW6_9MICO|nr:SDR family oxidoreductase [Leucobacter chromiiresistens]KTR85764.1 NAD-dependent dehydratase [Leucobacter chromiiresistens]